MGARIKVTVDMWIATARRALVDEGIAGVRVNRLAQRLGVTRGGFFHNFSDREELLAALLHHWEDSCRFFPQEELGRTAVEMGRWFERAIDWLIEEKGYDPQFDMAVREWARSDPLAAWAMERADRQRLALLETVFDRLGYDETEAAIRARTYYYHQIGYYAIGVRQTTAERRCNARIYIDILCGHDVMAQVWAANDRERVKVRA